MRVFRSRCSRSSLTTAAMERFEWQKRRKNTHSYAKGTVSRYFPRNTLRTVRPCAKHHDAFSKK